MRVTNDRRILTFQRYKQQEKFLCMTGALWVREGAPFSSIFLGGGQEEGRRAGTENTPMIVGLGEAARLVTLFLQQDTQHFTKVCIL